MRHRTVCAPFRLHSEVNVIFVLSSQEKLFGEGGREGEEGGGKGEGGGGTQTSILPHK
ncbi:hypothetical protein IscW_ISCW013766 [Ixodes scapularis]|uniref:Uncharacterized protein n=1 Tax=Ixodes scapularis TaxID=6945 RepID=B7QJG9_IXOSC|nr:hypothetical protein IscW_ISCW013766 [Ixodes scapularis]|eukprot:XP_002415326.1 hypothetical protein IscW_ISCW013766 [Ixodes scapularis]